MEHVSKKKKKGIIIFAWVLVFLWMGFIFYMSAQDSTSSSSFSRPLAESTAKYLARFHFIEEYKVSDAIYINELESTIRMLAHSTVFFILSVLVSLSLILSDIKGLRVLIISISLSLLYAFADEFHQFFVPGRATEMADIFLDMLGILLGTVLTLLFASLFTRKHKKPVIVPAKTIVSPTTSEKILTYKPRKEHKPDTGVATKPAKKKAKEKEVAVAIWFKIGFAISFSVLCAIISSNVKYMPLSALSAFFIMLVMIFTTKFLDKNIKKISIPRIIFSTFLSIFTIIRVYASFRLAANAYIAELNIVIDDLYYNFIRSGFSAFAVPSIMIIWYIMLGKAKELLPKIKITKKEIIYIALYTLGISAILLYVYYRTSVFYNPVDNNNVIFLLDSSTIVNEFSFTNFNSSINTIFQPIFSLGAMPFGVISRIISYPISILPGYDMAAAEALALSVVNALLIGITAILFSRAFEVKNKMLFIILMTITFPALFSLLLTSGNVVVAFYVALFLFIVAQTTLSFVPIATVLSSVFLPFAVLPLAIHKRKNKYKNIFKSYVYFAICVLLISNFISFGDILDTIKHVPRPSEIVPAFLNLSSMSIFAPISSVNASPYYTLEMESSTLLYALGAAVAIIAFIGFIIHRKEQWARVSTLAIIIGGVFLLYIIATLVPTNIMPYLICFSWAFTALIYKLAEKMFNPEKWLFKSIIIAAIIIIAIFNYNGIRDIVVFSFNYYSS